MQIFKEIIQTYWFSYLFNCLEDYGLSLGFFVKPRDLLAQIPFMTLGSFKKTRPKYILQLELKWLWEVWEVESFVESPKSDS